MRHKAHNQSSIVQILIMNKNLNFVREGTYLIYKKIYWYLIKLGYFFLGRLTFLSYSLRDYSDSVSPFIFLEMLLL